MPNWGKIRNEWETSDITFKDLAEKHGVKDSTIRSRKNREKWRRNGAKSATQRKKSVAAEKKQRYKEGSRKGAGNPSPDNQFTERNSAALKHGLFSRYIPKDTLEIMGMMDKDNPADLLWDQVMIQYAAIIRSQRIMFVEHKAETIKELKKLKVENVISADGKEVQMPIEQEYEIQFAWDRQAAFLNAQSRAISELRTTIKQFLEMAHDDDERRLKLEQMQLGIEKTRAETEKLKREANPDNSTEDKLKSYFEALGGAFRGN